MLHSIQNADGTVSIIQVDPNNQIITLPDGTTAQVQGIATVRSEREFDGAGGLTNRMELSVDTGRRRRHNTHGAELGSCSGEHDSGPD